MSQLHLTGKTVLITGASSGIGLACARAFAREGARVLVCARRSERLETLAAELRDEYGAEVHAFGLDVRDSDAVGAAIEQLPDAWKEIDVLVNNAGLSRGLDPLHKGKFQDWEEMIDTNIKGLLYVSRAVLPGMVERDRGHVVNIGSIAGHEVYPSGNVYCATKHAVDAITQGMRIDLLGTHVRVSTVDPGLVETEFSAVRFRGDMERAVLPYRGMTPLMGEDVADAVIYCVTRPPHVNVHQMILMPAAQATATQVYRKAEGKDEG